MHNPTTIQTNIWKRILWFTMCLLIYVLSFGPATFVANRIALPGDLVGKFVEIVYSPLILTNGLCPSFDSLLDQYCEIFR